MDRLGDRLRAMMREKGYVIGDRRHTTTEVGLAELARRAHVLPSFLSRLLGEGRPNLESGIESVRRLAEALECNFEWLAAGTGPREVGKDPARAAVAELIEDLRALPLLAHTESDPEWRHAEAETYRTRPREAERVGGAIVALRAVPRASLPAGPITPDWIIREASKRAAAMSTHEREAAEAIYLGERRIREETVEKKGASPPSQRTPRRRKK